VKAVNRSDESIGHRHVGGPTAWRDAQEGAAGDFRFNVRDFGATGDGTVLDTSAVNAAIEAAAASGGGTVYFPAGTYLCFSIRLLSNVQLSLSRGSTIRAANSPLPGEAAGQLGGAYDSAEPQDPSVEPYQDHGHNHWRNSLIWADGESKIGIEGPGRIHGIGLSNGFASGAGSEFDSEQAGVGNKAIAFKNCHDVTLRDFSILQGGWFGILLTGASNVTIDNLRIDTNRDGIDIDCCRNVHVSNCTVNSPWDDGICLKASYALGRLVPTQDVTITGCTVSGCYKLGTVEDGTFERFAGGPNENGNPARYGRIKLGTESNGGFQRIAITNCTFDGCYGLAIESVDGGACEDVVVTNLAMRDLVTGPLFIILGNRLRGPAGTPMGAMRRILVSNVVASNCDPDYPNIITGVEDGKGGAHCVEDVKIVGFCMEQRGGRSHAMGDVVPPEFNTAGVGDYPDPTIFGPMPAQGFFLRHIDNLEMSHVQITSVAGDERRPFVAHDVENATWMGITVPREHAGAAFALSPEEKPAVRGWHIHACQASGYLEELPARP
jgi:polygalacturonase